MTKIPFDDTEDSQLVDSTLVIRASEDLQKEIEEELVRTDPDKLVAKSIIGL